MAHKINIPFNNYAGNGNIDIERYESIGGCRCTGDDKDKLVNRLISQDIDIKLNRLDIKMDMLDTKLSTKLGTLSNQMDEILAKLKKFTDIFLGD